MNKKKKIFRNLFGTDKAVIGMVHVGALPGTPLYSGDFPALVKKAVEEALLYHSLGINAVMIENMHDVPYLNRTVGEEITAAMTRIASEIKNNVDIPLGVQVLAGANKSALAVAKASGAEFIRAEGFVFAHVADEGIMNSDAGELLRFRKTIDAENVLIFTDVKKKHSSHSVTEDVSIGEMAAAAEFFLSDGIIVTGKATGEHAEIEELQAVTKTVALPVLIGSGLTAENITQYKEFADGFIVGSYFKKEGKWFNPPDPDRIEKFLQKFGV